MVDEVGVHDVVVVDASLPAVGNLIELVVDRVDLRFAPRRVRPHTVRPDLAMAYLCRVHHGQALRRVQHVIDFGEWRIDVVVRPGRRGAVAEVVDVARQISGRQIGDDRRRAGTDAIGGNLVVGKLVADEAAGTIGARRGRVEDRNLAALRIDEAAEVAPLERFRRDGDQVSARANPRVEQAKTAEEERLAAAIVARKGHGTAEREPPFVLLVLGLLSLEERAGIQLVRPEVIEHAARQLVRARLDGDVAEPDPEAAVLGVEAVRHHAELANLFERRPVLRQRSTGDHLAAAPAVDEDFGVADVRAVRARVERGAAGEAGKVGQEAGDVAFVGRDNHGEFADHLLGKGGRVGDRRGVQVRGGDGDRLRYAGRVQHQVHANLDPGSEVHAIPRRGREAVLRDEHEVFADRQVGRRIQAFAVGGERGDRAGRQVPDLHFGVGHDAATLIRTIP